MKSIISIIVCAFLFTAPSAFAMKRKGTYGHPTDYARLFIEAITPILGAFYSKPPETLTPTEAPKSTESPEYITIQSTDGELFRIYRNEIFGLGEISETLQGLFEDIVDEDGDILIEADNPILLDVKAVGLKILLDMLRGSPGSLGRETLSPQQIRDLEEAAQFLDSEALRGFLESLPVIQPAKPSQQTFESLIQTSFHFDELPSDVFAEIFRHLSPLDRDRCRLVNRLLLHAIAISRRLGLTDTMPVLAQLGWPYSQYRNGEHNGRSWIYPVFIASELHMVVQCSYTREDGQTEESLSLWKFDPTTHGFVEKNRFSYHRDRDLRDAVGVGEKLYLLDNSHCDVSVFDMRTLTSKTIPVQFGFNDFTAVGKKIYLSDYDFGAVIDTANNDAFSVLGADETPTPFRMSTGNTVYYVRDNQLHTFATDTNTSTVLPLPAVPERGRAKTLVPTVIGNRLYVLRTITFENKQHHLFLSVFDTTTYKRINDFYVGISKRKPEALLVAGQKLCAITTSRPLSAPVAGFGMVKLDVIEKTNGKISASSFIPLPHGFACEGVYALGDFVFVHTWGPDGRDASSYISVFDASSREVLRTIKLPSLSYFEDGDFRRLKFFIQGNNLIVLDPYNAVVVDFGGYLRAPAR